MANEPLTKFIALQIESEHIGSVLSGKLGSDVALILDDPTPVQPDAQLTNFSIDTYPDNGGAHPVSLWRRMSFDELKQLAAALKHQEHHLPPTIDAALFTAYFKQVEAELANQPSARFTEARFAGISRGAGGIVAQYGLGVDVAGTIHDSSGIIAVEQHVVPRSPGRFRRLHKADRLSLAAALDTFVRNTPPPIDPLWQQLAQDASRG